MTEDDKALVEPCPFCGGEAERYKHNNTGATADWCGEVQHWVGCGGDCGASTCMHDTETEAVTAWNTRADSARIEAQAAEIERLRAERDAYKVALAAIVEPRIGGGEWAASVARKALTQHLANNATIGDLELPRRLVKHLGAEEPATLVFDILEDKKHRLWSNIGYRDERIMREVAAFLDPARAALGDTQ